MASSYCVVVLHRYMEHLYTPTNGQFLPQTENTTRHKASTYRSSARPALSVQREKAVSTKKPRQPWCGVDASQSIVKPVSSKQMHNPRHSSSSFLVSYKGRSSLLKHVCARGKALSLLVMDCSENARKLPSLLCDRLKQKYDRAKSHDKQKRKHQRYIRCSSNCDLKSFT